MLTAGVGLLFTLSQNAFDRVHNGLSLTVDFEIYQPTGLDRPECSSINGLELGLH